MAEMGNRVIFRQPCFPVRAYTGSTPARVNTMYCRWHLEDVWTWQRRRAAWLLHSVATNYRTNPTVRLREMTTESRQNRPRAVSHCNQLLQVARSAVLSVRGISTRSPSRMDCCHSRRSPPPADFSGPMNPPGFFLFVPILLLPRHRWRPSLVCLSVKSKKRQR